MSQLGTMKLQTESNSTINIPVFETGDAGSNVYEFLRVQTDAGVGFVPVTSNSDDAAYPYVRVQSENNGIVRVHDDALITGDWNTVDWNEAKWE